MFLQATRNPCMKIQFYQSTEPGTGDHSVQGRDDACVHQYHRFRLLKYQVILAQTPAFVNVVVDITDI